VSALSKQGTDILSSNLFCDKRKHLVDEQGNNIFKFSFSVYCSYYNKMNVIVLIVGLFQYLPKMVWNILEGGAVMKWSDMLKKEVKPYNCAGFDDASLNCSS
jgi:hypothetical protein